MELADKPDWSLIEDGEKLMLKIDNSDMTSVVHQLTQANITFSEIRHNHLNLEEIFLHLTGKKLRD